MLTAHRARILHCLSDPGEDGAQSAIEYFDDGMMVIEAGRIKAVGPAADLLPQLPDTIKIVEHGRNMIIPGLIDCHVHYPQMDVIASYGEQLLDWLTHYTFPAERRFADIGLAHSTANLFLDELLRNGTTSALVFATVHPGSVDALFEAANVHGMRIAAGKVMMDRNCPEDVRDTAESGYRESCELLERWHGQDRLSYAITPRFAPTSSNEQLMSAGRLAAEYPDAMIHTHLAENVDEVKWVAKLFPEARSYLDVYKTAGMLRERAVFAHCIHLDEQDYGELAVSGSAIAFCPTSNLFLGSGLFDLARARAHNIRVGLATDIGGGTSFSLLRTMSEAYKVLRLKQQKLSSFRGLYLATLGAAEALYMDDKIGNFSVGKEADFVVLNTDSTPLIAHRIAQTKQLSEELFVQMILGDDRAVSETYIMGQRRYAASAAS